MGLIDGLATDPLDIIYSVNIVDGSFYDSLQLGELAFMLRVAGLLVCLITISWSLIKLLFVNSPKQVQEEKEEISHRLWIVFLIGSIITLMNFVKEILDMFFT